MKSFHLHIIPKVQTGKDLGRKEAQRKWACIPWPFQRKQISISPPVLHSHQQRCLKFYLQFCEVYITLEGMNAWASARIIFIKTSLLLNDLLLCQRMWSPVQQFGIANLSFWINCSVWLCFLLICK